MKPFKKTISLIAVSATFTAALLQFQCQEPQKEEVEIPKFHSEENEGIWKGMSDNHLPVLSFTDSTKKELQAEVKLLPRTNPRHYIEAIALLKGNRQIDIKRFDINKLESPKAVFALPDDDIKSYRVVAKCNLHDMWHTFVED